MGKMTRIESATAWGWALEALASSETVAVSLLHDLIAQFPQTLPADLRRSIAERVSLRCLQELSSAAASPRRADLRFDLSESCEEALKRVMHESVECDVTWKLDIESFIKRKRDSMPKCALSRIKESISDGSHPYGEGEGVIAKKARWNASYVLQSIMDNLVPLAGSRTLERSLERNIAVNEGGGCVLESQEVTEERLVGKACADKSKDGCNGFGPDPTSGVGPSHEALHKVSAEHPVSVGGSKEKSVADVGRDESEQRPEPATLHVTPSDKTQKKVSSKEFVCISERDSHIDITPQVSTEVSQKKNAADGDEGQEQLDFVAMEKRKFLGSECAMTRYSNSTQKDHCLKCNGDDQLLICSTGDCPLVYHESCMGSEFISYMSGNFYCPFCAYSLHLKELLEAEQEALRSGNKSV